MKAPTMSERTPSEDACAASVDRLPPAEPTGNLIHPSHQTMASSLFFERGDHENRARRLAQYALGHATHQ